LSKLPLDSIILRSSKVLKPEACSEDWTLMAIRILARKLIVGVGLDKLADEWRIYQLEPIPKDWYRYTEYAHLH